MVILLCVNDLKKVCVYYDAQTGEIIELKSIINQIDKTKGLSVLRVDDKLINTDIINKIVRLK